MTKITRVNGNPEFQALMTYEEDQQKIFNSRMKSSFNQGIEQGESQRNVEIAKKLKMDGFSIEDIIKYTSLTKEEIEKI